MTNTQFATADLNTVKLWSNRIYRDFVSDTGLLSAMMSAGVVSKQEKTQNSAGDNVTVSFLQRQTGPGLIGNQAATGNENALTYFTDNVSINQLRYAIALPNKMTIDSQRVAYDMPEDTYKVSMDWLSQRGIVSCLYQMAGFDAASFTFDGYTYTGNARLALTGMNACVAPSSTRVYYPNGATNDETVNADTTATLKFTYIDELEALAETQRPYIRPISETSGIKYHLYVHTRQWQQLLQDTSAPIQFRDIFGNMIAGGKKDASIARSMVYSQTEIFKTNLIPNGISSATGLTLANTRRAVFCGKDAAVIAMGQGFSDGKDVVPGFTVRQDMVDIEQTKRVAISAIWGIKKIKFNGVDHGTIVLPTYVAQTS